MLILALRKMCHSIRHIAIVSGIFAPKALCIGPMATINVRKAAQAVAFFIQARGGKTDIVDAMKLIYLSDRESLRLFDTPIIDDDFAIMEYGPVDSATYDYAAGKPMAQRDIWEQYICKTGVNLTLTRTALDDDFDRLSDDEIRVMKSVAKKFANIKSFDLVDWVHENCAEWSDPGKTSWPLSYHRVFEVLGKKNSDALAERIDQTRNLKEAIAKAQ